ncbi:MAG TPA: glycosyltransferase [Kofleriaceae bacterium]|nr:glycosyltransferase [Kofleriaceae bacterium]
MADPPDGDPIRILHVFGVMDRGGAEMRTVELMRGMVRGRFQQEFCSLEGRRGALDEEIRALGGEVHACAVGPTFPARFLALVKARRIEVVHSHVHLASGVLMALAATGGVPRRIAHFRSTADDRGHGVRRRLYRRSMRELIDRFATDIVGCGEGAIVHGWSPQWASDPRCQVIHNGIDVDRFDLPDGRLAVRAELGLPPSTPLAIHVARFASPKNQTRIVDVFAAAARRGPGHLLFVGRGGTREEEAARARVVAQGMTQRVHFLGERTDVPRLLCASDVALLTSWNEGMPGAVLEAVAAGTAVVANDLPGVLEISRVLPGVTVRSLDDADDVWGASIDDAWARPATAAQRAAARERFRASHFSLPTAIARMEAVWSKARA